WDLYWIVTHPDARGSGVARALVGHMEEEIRGAGARLVRVETSRTDGYGAARAFYQRLQYPVVAELPDFYKPGDDLLVMLKRLGPRTIDYVKLRIALLALPLCLGCVKRTPAPPSPEIVDVRVSYRGAGQPDAPPLDVSALAATARDTIASAAG